MRMVDKVVQGTRLQTAWTPDGRAFQLTGTGMFSERIRRCEQRFILDRDASRRCADLFRTDVGMPAPSDPLARMIGERFWMECLGDGDGEPPEAMQTGRRFGLLVEADANGRAGSIACFSERADGEAEYLGCSLAFNLDSTPPPDGGAASYRIRQADLPAVDEFLMHSRLVFDDRWVAFARAHPRGLKERVAEVARLAWAALPMALCFGVLLSSTGALRQERSDLGRLNAARAKRGRQPLLDHVEVKLDLAGARAGVGRAQGERQFPRLHFVRGHTVHRAGMTFWRTSHFRGEGGEAPTRTVMVTSRGPGSAAGGDKPGSGR